MAQTQLLSDLCSICHSETPKYRCPRCKTQTCSLPCYKRHQQRAACSGKRDPAAYVKKNDLATPSGVDRDYNYLKGVERTIEDANRIASQHGLGPEAPTHRRSATGRHPSSALSRYLERNSITIEHAPVGISRQKSNNTRTTKGGNIHWTVEWVDAQGERCTRDDCLESATLTELYTAIQKAKQKEERRQLEAQRAAQAQARRLGLKRKREQSPASSQQRVDETAIKQEVEFLRNVEWDEALSAANKESTELSDGSSSLVVILTEAFDSQKSVDQEPTTPTASSKQESDSHTNTESSPTLYFYLLKPTTATASRVLIPLKAEATLTDSLRNQTVLEYPTIYALPNAPQALGDGFMLETEYAATKNSHEKIRLRSTRNEDQTPREELQAKRSDDNAPLDAKSILAMLKRDVAL